MTETRARWRSIATWAALYVAISSVLGAILCVGDGLLDWDTYDRLQFIDVYRPDIYADTHVLYHYVLRTLMAIGLSPESGIVVMTAAAAGAYVLLVVWIGVRLRLERWALALLVAAATIGSPGVVSLYLFREDNVPYLPLVLALYYLLFTDARNPGHATRTGVWCGALLALGMLLNVTLLVVLIALAPVVVLWPIRPLCARRAAVTIIATLVVYYAVSLVVFHGAKIALHEFLPQALRFDDHTAASAPLLSHTRLDQYLGGLRAIAIDPDVHLMALPARVRMVMIQVAPKLLGMLYVALFIDSVVRDRNALWRGAIARLDLMAVLGIALAFPYLYEPILVERWDVLWMGLILVIAVRLARRPSRLAIGLISAIVAIQTLGSALTIAHHFGLGFAKRATIEMRTTIQTIRDEHRDPVILPFTIDRLLLAELTARAPGRRFVLVRDDGPDLTCFDVVYLAEVPVPLGDIRAALRRAKMPYLSAEISQRARGLLGR